MENYDAIDKALNVKAEIQQRVKPKRMKPAETPDQIQQDYEYSRAQLYNLVEKGQEAVNGILDVAQDSQHPRAYEVAGQLIKHVGDVTDKLADLQKKMKDLDEDKGPKQVTNNSLFVGSTADLQKMIKEMGKTK
jgi:methylmalonyl-CoA mutase N-terminal domain/subunit|tara:strand:+ start:28 stop:429 length:402 start_codon:yes stop_codon:yes gene_type:complete